MSNYEAGSIDPVYYDLSYYVAPDGRTGEDVYAVLRKAIEQTGRVALSRVVIAQRERTIALRPMQGGIAARTLNEERDLNNAKPLFEGAQLIKTDPDMVKLAVQLIDRQTSRYDPSDTEDRYETRLRTMIEAKLKGEGLQDEQEPEADRSNVIDLMAALKQSLGPAEPEAKPPARKKAAAADKTSTADAPAQAASKPPRKRA